MLPVAAGLWKFIGNTKNDRNPSWPTVQRRVTFEPANGNVLPPRVLTFEGNYESYVVLNNVNGGLGVASFTWAAKIKAYDLDNGPLFNWVSTNDAENQRYSKAGMHLFLHTATSIYESIIYI